MSHIGQPMARLEDMAMLRGLGTYTGDLAGSDALEIAFARSWAAHGLITNVDVGLAGEQEGVAGAWSAAELPFPVTPASVLNSPPDGMEWPSLATRKVRYVGEPVAIVAARDRYAAEDGADAVQLEIKSLPAVLDPTEAAADDAPLLFEQSSNVVLEGFLGEDVERDFARAELVLKGTFRQPRVAHMALEGRAFLAIPEGGGLEVFCSHQAPHRLHTGLCEALALSADRLRVRIPHVGGAFGGKSQTYPEYVAIAYLALHLNRPLRWIEDRAESFVAAPHGRGQNLRMSLAASREGRITALQVELDTDAGAYPHTGAFLSRVSAYIMSGPYRIPRLSVRFRSVLTNAVPTAPYRGAGRPEPTFALEVMVDRLAAEIGLDPGEVRARNFIAPSEFPYRTATGETYDSGDYLQALEMATERSRSSAAVRPHDPRLLSATGIASFVDTAGGRTSPNEFARVTIKSDGRIVVKSGSVSTGQGHRTTFAQIAASVLELGMSDVEVMQGDSDWEGLGTFASRSVQFGGSAVLRAASTLLERARDRASEILEVSGKDLEYSKGSFHVLGAPSKSVTLAAIAARGELVADHVFSGERTSPFGCYVVTLSVDEETGMASVEHFVAVDDCGNMVNPLLVAGQSCGSIAQGLGGSLYETIIYDEVGQPLTASMMDYLAPTLSEIPAIELLTTVTPSPNNPLGAKGAAEAGCLGAPAAVANALQGILRQVGASVDHLELPFTPEKIWWLLKQREEQPWSGYEAFTKSGNVRSGF